MGASVFAAETCNSGASQVAGNSGKLLQTRSRREWPHELHLGVRCKLWVPIPLPWGPSTGAKLLRALQRVAGPSLPYLCRHCRKVLGEVHHHQWPWAWARSGALCTCTAVTEVLEMGGGFAACCVRSVPREIFFFFSRSVGQVGNKQMGLVGFFHTLNKSRMGMVKKHVLDTMSWLQKNCQPLPWSFQISAEG